MPRAVLHGVGRLMACAALLAAFGGPGAAHAAGASPYAGEMSRPIKALSEADVAGLLAGKGMGYAKAAELNGYPGPAHVLELAEPLALTTEQLARTRAVHGRMEAEARAAGERLVAAERELDALFADAGATPERLRELLRKVAASQAAVREAHLRAHVEQRALLSDEQVARYGRLRGYASADAAGAAETHHPHHPHHPPQGHPGSVQH